MATTSRSPGLGKWGDLGDLVYATDFGVRPGPVITVNLQAAMDAAAGKTLVLPHGTLDYTSQLRPKGSLIGQGPGTYLRNINAAGAGARLLFDEIDGFSVSELRAGTENADGSAVSGNEAAFYVDECEDFKFHNLLFTNQSGTCILLQDAQYGVVKGIEMKGCWKDGIHHTHGSSDIVTSDIVCRDGGDDVVAVVGYVSAGRFPRRIVIKGVTVNGTKSGRGIAVVGGSDVTISDFNINGAYMSGLNLATEVSFGTYGTENVRVSNGIIRGCGRSTPAAGAGIQVTGRSGFPTKNISLSGIDVYDSSYRGITVFGTTDGRVENLRVRDVVISDTTDQANRNGAGVGAGAFSGMEFTHTKDLQVVDCTVHRSGGHGIYVSNTNTGKITLRGNRGLDINVSGTAGNDFIQVQSSTTADLVVTEDNWLGNRPHTLDRFIENVNLGKTRAVGNASNTIAAVVSQLSNTSITVTASPFKFQNPNNYEVAVVITGGTVSVVEVSSDDTTYFAAGWLQGTHSLQPGSWIRVTYSGAPTMVWRKVTA